MACKRVLPLERQYLTRPSVLSPQLEDFSILDHMRHPVSCDNVTFTLAFDVSYVKPEELTISFPNKNQLQLNLKHNFKNTGELTFSRDCLYLYGIPDDVNIEHLICLWTDDDFLIIKEDNEKSNELIVDVKPLRKQTPLKPKLENRLSLSKISESSRTSSNLKTTDLKQKASPKVKEAKKSAEILKKSTVPRIKDTEPTVERPNKLDLVCVLTPGSKEVDCKTPTKAGAADEKNFPPLIPVRVQKVYKPCLDVMKLKDLMSDIEDRLTLASHFIENCSFATSRESSSNHEPKDTKSTEVISKDPRVESIESCQIFDSVLNIRDTTFKEDSTD